MRFLKKNSSNFIESSKGIIEDSAIRLTHTIYPLSVYSSKLPGCLTRRKRHRPIYNDCRKIAEIFQYLSNQTFVLLISFLISTETSSAVQKHSKHSSISNAFQKQRPSLPRTHILALCNAREVPLKKKKRKKNSSNFLKFLVGTTEGSSISLKHTHSHVHIYIHRSRNSGLLIGRG